MPWGSNEPIMLTAASHEDHGYRDGSSQYVKQQQNVMRQDSTGYVLLLGGLPCGSREINNVS